MISRLISHTAKKIQLRMMLNSVVHEENGVKVVDVRSDAGNLFGDVISESLRLIRECDDYRYRRVTSLLDWIICIPLSFEGARYRHYLKACEIDFIEAERYLKEDSRHFSYYSVYYASVLVHEATHGRIRCYLSNIDTEAEKFRSEQICRSEEAKLLSKIHSHFPELPIPEITPLNKGEYRQVYSLSYWGHAKKQFLRILKFRSN